MLNRRTFMAGLVAVATPPAIDAGVVDWFNGVRLGALLPDHDGVFVQGTWQASSRLVLVDFWATWCAPCVAAIPKLNALQSRHGTREFQVIGVSDEALDVVTPFVTRKGIEYAVVAGGERPLRDTLKIRGLPYAVLVDAEQRIVWRGQPDALDDATLDEHLGPPIDSA
jgi:thiol-disulfide isomerase/thioredoxin